MSSTAQPEGAPARRQSVRYRVRHSSSYRYGNDIMLAHHLLHLTPRAVAGQRVLAFRMQIEPTPSVIAEHRDYFDNPMTYIEMHEPHVRLTVRTDIDVEVEEDHRPEVAAMDTPWEVLRDQLNDPVDHGAREASAFAYVSPMILPSADLYDFALPSFPSGRPIGEAAMELTNRIHAEFAFDPGATMVSTPVADVLADRRGVCQDFAHLEIGCLRSIGLAARYVSGYLRTCPFPGKPRTIGTDVSHAWASVWCGSERWMDMDPTNGRPGSSDLITLAWGRDYGDVSPLQGVIIGSSIQRMIIEVDVE
jgi:transglutaminase-like putative cysteine protease